MAIGAAGGRIAAGAGANLLSAQTSDRNQDATCFVGSIDLAVSEEILWELFTQVAPVVHVYLPKDRVTGEHQGYGFVELKSEEDAAYAIKVLNMVKLYGKPIRVAPASQDKDSGDVGANLFIGNLDPDVDETLLHTTFSAFGEVVNNPKVMRIQRLEHPKDLVLSVLLILKLLMRPLMSWMVSIWEEGPSLLDMHSRRCQGGATRDSCREVVGSSEEDEQSPHPSDPIQCLLRDRNRPLSQELTCRCLSSQLCMAMHSNSRLHGVGVACQEDTCMGQDMCHHRRVRLLVYRRFHHRLRPQG
eukprot:jgi/Picre1/27210/NNA_000179.t1